MTCCQNKFANYVITNFLNRILCHLKNALPQHIQKMMAENNVRMLFIFILSVLTIQDLIKNNIIYSFYVIGYLILYHLNVKPFYFYY